MKRRTFLTASAMAAAASAFPAPAISQGIRELKLVCSFPMFPGLQLIAQTISELSGGRLTVKAFGADELVGSFEVFDAVSEGVAEMYYSTEYYWQDRSPAFPFFTTIPFGLTPAETYAWIYLGGGQELWDELSAQFNLKPFAISSSGIQMGGWFTKEMTSINDFKGLRYRIPGIGGEVMRRLGTVVVNLPPGEIVTALSSGALDAAEWVGPFDDRELGLHTVAKYYYYPGFHEPGTTNSFGINRKLWQSLSSEDRTLIATIVASQYTYGRAEIHVDTIKALPSLLDNHRVQLRKFDDATLKAFGKASGEVVAEIGASDSFTRRVYDSYMKFREASRRWTDISERAYLNARALDFPYGI